MCHVGVCGEEGGWFKARIWGFWKWGFSKSRLCFLFLQNRLLIAQIGPFIWPIVVSFPCLSDFARRQSLSSLDKNHNKGITRVGAKNESKPIEGNSVAMQPCEGNSVAMQPFEDNSVAMQPFEGNSVACNRLKAIPLRATVPQNDRADSSAILLQTPNSKTQTVASKPLQKDAKVSHKTMQPN